MNSGITWFFIFAIWIFFLGMYCSIPIEHNVMYNNYCAAACVRRNSVAYNRTDRECVCRDENNNFVILHSDFGAAFHE